jgi:hypothetical protein
MADMIQGFFDRAFESAHEKTSRLPFVLFVSAGKDGRGDITPIERIEAGCKGRKVQEHSKLVGRPTEKDLCR